ncbi:MAG: hypothetical protein ACXAEU_01595 [Candidatus Hodarchaeales archaeon]|jgi:hypothetical protein
MNKEVAFDLGKITAMITGSTILGIFLGSRSGGTYVFEVGSNLMVVLLAGMVVGSSLMIGYLWLSKE